MGKRPAKPDNQSWLSPYLVVKDADAALAFYEKAFGLKKKLSMPGPDGKTVHAEVLWHDITIMFGPEQPGQPAKPPASSRVRPAIGLYLYCEDVDAVYKRALAAGAKSDRAPQDMFYGDRVCAVLSMSASDHPMPNKLSPHFARFLCPLANRKECNPRGLKLAAGPTRGDRVFIHQDSIMVGVELFDCKCRRSQKSFDCGERAPARRWIGAVLDAREKGGLLSSVTARVTPEGRGPMFEVVFKICKAHGYQGNCTDRQDGQVPGQDGQHGHEDGQPKPAKFQGNRPRWPTWPGWRTPPKNDPPMWFGGRTDGGQTRTKPSALGLGLVAALLRRGDLDAADA